MLKPEQSWANWDKLVTLSRNAELSLPLSPLSSVLPGALPIPHGGGGGGGGSVRAMLITQEVKLESGSAGEQTKAFRQRSNIIR